MEALSAGGSGAAAPLDWLLIAAATAALWSALAVLWSGLREERILACRRWARVASIAGIVALACAGRAAVRPEVAAVALTAGFDGWFVLAMCGRRGVPQAMVRRGRRGAGLRGLRRLTR